MGFARDEDNEYVMPILLQLAEIPRMRGDLPTDCP